MRKLFGVLLIVVLLLPGAAIAQDALPYLAVGAAPCQFNFDFQIYGTIWRFTSVGSETQNVKMYAYYSDATEMIYNRLLYSGEQTYLEEWNFTEPPEYYLIQTFDSNNFMTGEQYYTIQHCTRRLWIPKVEGVNVATE